MFSCYHIDQPERHKYNKISIIISIAAAEQADHEMAMDLQKIINDGEL
jgi:hypothetical protein